MDWTRNWLPPVVILLVAVVVLFTNLGGPRLWDRDEPRNAGCAAEMLQRGDWIVPVFNAELRAHKPVLLYWLIMSAYSVLGVHEFAARFWSALLAVGTVAATYRMGSRMFSPRVGQWAGVILATSLMFGVAGRAATPDSVLVFFATLALLFFVEGAFQPGSGFFPARTVTVTLMYAMMGLAVLAKGPVGFVLPTAVIGMFLLIVRLPAPATEAVPITRWRRLVALLRPFGPRHFLRTCWHMRLLWGLLVVTAVALPWYAWVGWRTDGEFLREFFWKHNLGRAAQAMEGHRGPVVYYPAAIMVGFFPWSMFAIPAAIGLVRGLRRRDERRAGYLLASCWIGVYVGLFSLARTKLPSYVTPCYPALAMLTACFIDDWIRGVAPVARRWPRLGFVTLGLVGVGMIVTLPLLAHRFLPGEELLGLVGVIPLSAAVVGLVLIRKERVAAAAGTFATAAVLFTTSLFAVAAARVDRHQQNDRLLAAIDGRGGEPRVGAFGCLEPSWVFYGGRPIQELSADKPAETARRDAGTVPTRSPAAEFFGDGADRYIITTDRHWPTLQPLLPPTATVLAECPRLFRRDQLLLIGRSPAHISAAASAVPRTGRKRS